MKPKSLIGFLSLLFLVTLASVAQNAPDQSKSQDRIAREVRRKMLIPSYFGVFDNLAFKVDGGTVILTGQVVRPSLKSDAENSVKHVEGVEKVDNQIEVLPPSSMDDGIRLRLFRAVCGYPSLWRSIPWVCRSRFELSSRAAE